MAQASPDTSIKAYWQPGCTSCLRMKEFLTKHGVPFVSVNVLEDKDAFAELATLGIRSVPIIRRGQRLGERPGLARRGARRRHPMGRRAGLASARAGRTADGYPESGTPPFRADPRRQDSVPCCRIAPAATPSSPTTSSTSPMRSWSTRSQGLPLKEGVYGRIPPPEMDTKAKILAYGQDVLRALRGLVARAGADGRLLRARPTSTTATLRCTNSWSARRGTPGSTCASSSWCSTCSASSPTGPSATRRLPACRCRKRSGTTNGPWPETPGRAPT